jgi:MFS family permease
LHKEATRQSEEESITDRNQASDSARRGGRFRLLEPLKERNFFLLWLGEGVSVLGNHFYMLALTWVILDVLGEPGLALGTILMTAAIPRAVLMLFTGALSDRLSPRLLMLASNGFRAVVVGLMAFLILAHSQDRFVLELWHLYAFAAVIGAASAFFMPAMMTLLPRLVGRERLEQGNAIVMATSQVSGMVGPALAGVVVATAGTAAAMGANAATFTFGTLTLLLMTGLRLRPGPGGDGTAPDQAQRSSILDDIREVLRYVRGHPAMRVMLPEIAVTSLCFGGPIAVGLPTIIHDLTGEATALGTVMAVFGGASVVGSLLAGSVRLRHRGRVLIGVLALMGVGIGALGLASNVLTMALLMGVIALGNGLVNVMMIAWYQREVRPDMLGRLMSMVMFAAVGLQPISLALAGWLVDLNPIVMFAGAGGLVLAAALFIASSRAVRAID